MRTQAANSLFEDDLEARARCEGVAQAEDAVGHNVKGLNPYLGYDNDENGDNGVEDTGEE